MFYRMVNGSFSSDDEDNVPLAQGKRESFKQLMPVPAKNTEKTATVRRKAINYRGTPITKDLFDRKKDLKNEKDKRSRAVKRIEKVGTITHVNRSKRLL
mgnify:CR=1 FL=1